MSTLKSQSDKIKSQYDIIGGKHNNPSNPNESMDTDILEDTENQHS